MLASSYIPRNSGHDYYGRGTYLITLVVASRAHLLTHFATNIGRKGNGFGREAIALTSLGEAVQQLWYKTPQIQATYGNRVTVHACVCMPDHFHGVIEVLESMEWSLGDIIQAFKAACISR